MTIKTPRIGAISNGTHQPESLLPAFGYELERLTRDMGINPWRQLMAEAKAYATVSAAGHLSLEGLQAAQDIVGELIDALNELAPAYTYFGAAEGDGACFGFWPCLASLEDAIHEGECIKVAEGVTLPPITAATYATHVAYVSDHGNIRLVSRTIDGESELWSCV